METSWKITAGNLSPTQIIYLNSESTDGPNVTTVLDNCLTVGHGMHCVQLQVCVCVCVHHKAPDLRLRQHTSSLYETTVREGPI